MLKMISPADLADRDGQSKLVVVDVRMPFDYFGGRVPGSINYPGELMFEDCNVIPPESSVVFVCNDGEQSRIVATRARAEGYDDVAVLAGGIDAWLDADLPVETIADGNMQI